MRVSFLLSLRCLARVRNTKWNAVVLTYLPDPTNGAGLFLCLDIDDTNTTKAEVLLSIWAARPGRCLLIPWFPEKCHFTLRTAHVPIILADAQRAINLSKIFPHEVFKGQLIGLACQERTFYNFKADIIIRIDAKPKWGDGTSGPYFDFP